MLETVAVIDGFYDLALMSEPIEQCRDEFLIDKDIVPFREAQVGDNNNTVFFIEFADQMERKDLTVL